MEIPSLPDVIDLITLICVWLFLRPQQAENEAIHASIDRLSASMDKLSDELQASREKVKTLFTNQEDMKGEIDELRKNMLECRRGDKQCLKN